MGTPDRSSAIFVIGPPGAGKTTLTSFLAERLNLREFRSGDVFRKLASEPGGLAIQAEISLRLERNQPMDIDIYCEVLQLHVESIDGTFSGIVFDGFPRDLNQCEGIPEVLAAIDMTDANVTGILLQARPEVSSRRIAARSICQECGENTTTGKHETCASTIPVPRSDNPAASRRITSHHQSEQELTTRFRQRWPLHTIAADQSAEQVAAESLDRILNQTTDSPPT
ncbi:MAG TPA: nucleoside monophosphate kinase [Kribbella sp.]|uniref:nucleoside monophosphate kinase n=1 Tax=Kribbella sp. TaxID=1871183 RepID=UPI002D787DD3|nr:nucleoside monophosphate kinase [Kribbella sp.]HET6296602.1 nucleoside monophosphate kinase [Kribbella sp.]